jgi:hypothetical protein
MRRYWREWWAVVCHPFAYVRFCAERERAEAVVMREVARRAGAGPLEREWVYVGPLTEGRIPFESLPKC